jgi:RES domain-containing protein
VRFTARCYRAHDPHWSFTPLSGEGAAQTGGRFNPKGRPALYLALDPVTALLEVTQGFTNRLHPLILCEYEVDCADIADLREDAGRAAEGVSHDDLAAPWLMYQRAGKLAPSQTVAIRLMKQGCAGSLVPSFAPGSGAHNGNLVLWKWGPDLPHKVRVFDPTGRLPKDQLSWR